MVEKSIILEEKRAVMQYNKDKKLCLLTQYIEVFIEWNKTCNSHAYRLVFIIIIDVRGPKRQTVRSCM
jgi:hypothetical protein